MTTRRMFLSLGFIAALGAPYAAFADIASQSTKNENALRSGDISTDGQYAYQGEASGWQLRQIAAPQDTRNEKAFRPGDISADRQYVYQGEASGWQLRPMQYRFENGRFAHLDDPAGHMLKSADNTPITPQQRAAIERSGGS
jgi:hypothetical protein